MNSKSDSFAPPPPLVFLAGWVLPGLGYWLIGQRTRATVVGVSVLLTFVLGVMIGGIRVVDAPALSGKASAYVNKVVAKPWFIGQVLTGPVSLGASWWSAQVAADPKLGKMHARGRLADIGTLYTAVAGMLNLMAMIDAAHRAGRENH